jgi:hypothetical protein
VDDEHGHSLLSRADLFAVSCLYAVAEKTDPTLKKSEPFVFPLRPPWPDSPKFMGKPSLRPPIFLSVFAVFGIQRLEVENSFIDYFKQSTEIYKGMAVIDRQLGGTTPLDVIVAFEPADAETDFLKRTMNSPIHLTNPTKRKMKTNTGSWKTGWN